MPYCIRYYVPIVWDPDKSEKSSGRKVDQATLSVEAAGFGKRESVDCGKMVSL